MHKFETNCNADIRVIIPSVLLALALIFGCSPSSWSAGAQVIDSKGTVIIPPKCDSITYVGEGIFRLETYENALVGRHGEVEFADANGKRVYPAYLLAKEQKTPELPPNCSIGQREGRYLIVSSPEGSGLFSDSGREIIPLKYQGIVCLGDNLFATEKFNENSYGMYDRLLFDGNGKVVNVLPSWFSFRYRTFHEGLMNIGDWRCAYMDEKGKIVVDSELYQNGQDFSDGLAAVTFRQDGDNYAAYINHQGKVAVGPFKATEASPFRAGTAIITGPTSDGTSRSGAVTPSGKFAVPQIYDSLGQSLDGYFYAKKDGRHMVLDSKGKPVFELGSECESVEWPDKFTGDSLIACGFKSHVSNQKQPDDLTWGYCDRTGKVVIKPQFSMCFPFKGDHAVIRIMSLDERTFYFGVIDRQGHVIVTPKYKDLSLATSDRFIVNSSSPAQTEKPYFGKALRDHALIGMNKTDVDKLIGVGQASPCNEHDPIGLVSITNYATQDCCFQIGYDKNDQALGWRQVSSGCVWIPYQWITENVTIRDPRYGFDLGNLVPKD